MSHRMPIATTADALRRFCSRVAAGLRTRAVLAEKVAIWDELAEECLSVDIATKKGQDEVEAAWVVERIEDADWRVALDALAARMLSLAGDKPTQPPYETVFGRVSAREVAALGAGKTELGARLVEGMRKMLSNAPGWRPLEALVEGFAAANDRLKAASELRAREDELVLGFELARAKLVRRVNREADLTEAFVLGAFPGRGDVVRALMPDDAVVEGHVTSPIEMEPAARANRGD